MDFVLLLIGLVVVVIVDGFYVVADGFCVVVDVFFSLFIYLCHLFCSDCLNARIFQILCIVLLIILYDYVC